MAPISNNILIDERLKCTVTDFEIRATDVYLIGLPRTETIWWQKIIWHIGHDDAKSSVGDETFPVLYLFPLSNEDNKYDISMKDSFIVQKPKGLWDIYLPKQFLDGTKKPVVRIFYFTRTPQDFCVFIYYFLINLPKGKLGTLEDCWDPNLTEVYHSSYCDHDSNDIIYFTFEEVKEDLYSDQESC